MGISFSSVVDAPVDEVFAWHARPGAVVRLTPPWLPMKLKREAASIRDGRAEFSLVPGVRLVARHDPRGYVESERFVDVLETFPVGALGGWRHCHEFTDLGGTRTRATDRVDTPVPERLLRAMFVYRHRQLADDLAAHAWARALRPEPMTVAVTGSSGLIGTALTALLTTGGHRVIRLVRGRARGWDERFWNPERPAADLLDDVDAVVHLAGESIAGRFTEEHKREIRDSRVTPTRLLAERAAATGVEVFACASAIGFYGPDRGDEVLTEHAAAGDGFLAGVVADWEAATEPAAEGGVRVVRVRTGIVQSPNGGALRLQRPLFSAALGGRIGSGRQWTSWIGIDDLTDIYLRALVDSRLSGPVNAVSPHPLRNAEYTDILAGVLHRPALIPVPAFGPRLLLGREGAAEIAEAGQRVVPAALAAVGHRFRFPSLEGALRHVLGKARAVGVGVGVG
ncbi:TIGR01777 family oxidoreductase [Phytomonospora sp. NPDC050363]|uniref:TIGR01777 family oxidoreductase n=1 Tax=Phytomonospora sp. NPDC050363 TaxID=3155642 RepID=UPI0033DE18B7